MRPTLSIALASAAVLLFASNLCAQRADLQHATVCWGTLAPVSASDPVRGRGDAGPGRDWSCDSDFGDLDGDSHVDWLHSSYGPGITGNVPGRSVLNDTTGVLDERFSPADPAADIETHTIDFDLADFDSGFDRNLDRDIPSSASHFNDIAPVALIDQGAILVGSSNYEGEYGDVDGDGDFDVWVKSYDGPVARGVTSTPVDARFSGDADSGAKEIGFGGFGPDGQQGQRMFKNVLGVPDTQAPLLSQVTVQGGKPNGTPTVIHGAIRDNGPSEWLTNYFDWTLVYSVNDGPPISVPMVGQFGAQARGVIPAQTNATVDYHVECTDLAGNTGVSVTTSFFQGADSRANPVSAADVPLQEADPATDPAAAPLQCTTSCQADGSAPRSTP